MKKSFLIATLLATTALATSAWADCANDQSCGTNCCWNLTGGTLTISGIGAMINYASSNDVPWYSDRSSITSVVIQKGITSIGDRAFIGATNLAQTTISDTVTSIGTSAFQSTGLTSIIIPDSVTSIGATAFYRASSLTNVTIGNSVTSIGRQVFDGTHIANITLPDSVQSIDARAFEGLDFLKSIVVSDSLTSAGNYAFNVYRYAQIYCSNETCKTLVTNAGFVGANFNNDIKNYTKDDKGVYYLVDSEGNALPNGDNPTYYASAEDMQTGASASCGNHDACVAKVQEYKEAKAASMAGGTLCQTTQGCLNLMDLVASSTSCKAGEANSYANCSAAVRNGTITGVNLAAADPEPAVVNPGGAGGTGSSTGSGKRIYTVEEARAAVEAAGTDTVNFRIRYK